MRVGQSWSGGSQRARIYFATQDFLIVDDCTLHRENLAAILVANGTAIPSVAWDLPSLIRALDDTTPSIVVLNMGTRDTQMLLRAAREISPNVRVIVVGLSEDDESEIVACARRVWPAITCEPSPLQTTLY